MGRKKDNYEKKPKNVTDNTTAKVNIKSKNSYNINDNDNENLRNSGEDTNNKRKIRKFRGRNLRRGCSVRCGGGWLYRGRLCHKKRPCR